MPNRGNSFSELPEDAFQRDDALRGVSGLDRLTSDMQLGKVGAERRLVRWLERNPSAEIRQRRDGWLALCAARFREHRIAEAIAACEQAEALQPGSAAGAISMLQVLRQAPASSWSVSGVVLELHDRRVSVSHAGVSFGALIDTGAEVAFVSESAARQLRGRPLTGQATIGTTTTPVAGGLVTFPSLQVAGAELRNVSAAVLPDSQMAYTEESMVLRPRSRHQHAARGVSRTRLAPCPGWRGATRAWTINPALLG